VSLFFDPAATDYVFTPSAPVSAAPLTLACWIYVTDLTTSQVPVSLNDADGTHAFYLFVTATSGYIRAYTIAGFPPTGVAITSSGAGAGAWHHACGVFAAANDRAVFLDGGSKGTNAVNKTPSGIDQTVIGAHAGASPSGYMHGHVAEVGIWNAALADDEVAVLAQGFTPPLVRPQSLALYCPAVRYVPEYVIRDLAGGLTLLPTGSVAFGDPPPVLRPTGPIVTTPPGQGYLVNRPTRLRGLVGGRRVA